MFFELNTHKSQNQNHLFVTNCYNFPKHHKQYLNWPLLFICTPYVEKQNFRDAN